MGTAPQIVGVIESFGQAHREILGVFLFGSVAAGTNDVQSDVDIAVLLDATPDAMDSFQLATAYSAGLEDIFDRNVDVVILNNASPMLQHQVFRKGKLVFARDLRRVKRFVSDAVIEYIDEMVLIERLQKRAIRRVTDGR